MSEITLEERLNAVFDCLVSEAKLAIRFARERRLVLPGVDGTIAVSCHANALSAPVR